MITVKRCLALLLLGLVGPLQASTDTPTRNGTFSFVLENDLFYDVDQHYTNGVGFIWVPDRSSQTPKWAARLARTIPWFPQQGVVRHGYAFGQSMFTPSDITLKDPPLDDRPYAGWVYGTVGLGVGSGKQFDLVAFSLGMVGPASLAEQSQKVVHKAIGADEPQGWGTQLGNEPGVVVTYLRSWRELATRTALGPQFDLSPHVGAAVGNVFTYANTGLTLRYGRRLPNDFGPPRIQPGLLGSGEFLPSPEFNWYLFAGFEGRAVARNIFLDGNTFSDSRSVDKLPLLGDLQYGLVLEYQQVRLAYTHVVRSREFKEQSERYDEFGAISLSISF